MGGLWGVVAHPVLVPARGHGDSGGGDLLAPGDGFGRLDEWLGVRGVPGRGKTADFDHRHRSALVVCTPTGRGICISNGSGTGTRGAFFGRNHPTGSRTTGGLLAHAPTGSGVISTDRWQPVNLLTKMRKFYVLKTSLFTSGTGFGGRGEYLKFIENFVFSSFTPYKLIICTLANFNARCNQNNITPNART